MFGIATIRFNSGRLGLLPKQRNSLPLCRPLPFQGVARGDMPNRYLKEKYITSPRINAVDAEARDCWTRLLLVVDDHGRYFADPQLVASRCYPLSPDARKCARMLAELAQSSLIVTYRVDGKDYLQLTQWSERVRSKSKYPDLPDSCAPLLADANNGEHLPALAGNGEQPLSDAGSGAQLLTIAASRVARASVSTSTSTSTSIPPNARSDISFDPAVGWSGITERDRVGWLEAFPGVALSVEIAKAREWAIDHPKNRKSNWRRFLTNWLARAQDSARPIPPNGGAHHGSTKVAL